MTGPTARPPDHRHRRRHRGRNPIFSRAFTTAIGTTAVGTIVRYAQPTKRYFLPTRYGRRFGTNPFSSRNRYQRVRYRRRRYRVDAVMRPAVVFDLYF